MFRRIALTCLTAVALLGALARPLSAQEAKPSAAAGSQEPSQEETPAAAPEAKPRPTWHGSANLGVALAGGIQSQRGYQVGASVTRPFSDGGSVLASVSREYQNVTFPSESLLADRTAIAVGVEQNLTSHTVAMVRSLYLRDQLLLVDARYEELFGYGLRLYDKAGRFELHLVPGVSFFKEDLSYTDLLAWQSAAGFFEKLTVRINEAWSVNNSFRLRRNFKSPDRSIESLVALNGMITKTLGIQLNYQYNYESIVPPNFPNYLQILSVGLRFQF